MIATVAFVSWGEEKGVEEDTMKEIISKYRAPAAKKAEKKRQKFTPSPFRA
jgi:hypothetical protein